MYFLSISTVIVLLQSTSCFRLGMTTTSNVKTSSINNDVIKNDLMIRVAKGEPVKRTPVWVFRQAGRHLPEYNSYKSTKNKNFLELLNDPVDVCECTMQPIRRYNLDAAILFSDILVILQALGMDVTMPGGVGIQVPSPLSDPSEVKSRVPTNVDVKKKLSHVMEAVRLIKYELENKVPLIGFSAAPWTLMFYMVGGSSKKNQDIASNWLKMYPVESKSLLNTLSNIVIDYTRAQIDAGADMMQIFEAMGEHIGEADFVEWALPCLQQIANALHASHPNTPLLVFPRGATYSLPALQAAGYDIVTLDASSDRGSIRSQLASCPSPRGTPAGVQGNFPVNLLKPATPGSVTTSELQAVHREVFSMLKELGAQNLIANLSEGLGGNEDPILVAAFVNAVHEHSEALIKDPNYSLNL